MNPIHIEQLKTLFNVSSEKNALVDWQSAVIATVQKFLDQIKQEVIQKNGLTLSSLMISYVPEAENSNAIENAAQILKLSLSTLGVTVSLSPLTTAEALKNQLQTQDVLLVLCTPVYAQKIAEEPVIRQVIDAFGKSKNDSLMTLLCEGGFGDTALKIVDGHYLIRAYQGALKVEASLTSLQTFIDVIFSVSGSQGLGLLPDLLDLEKMERAKAYGRYKELFQDLSNTLQALTNQYRLNQDVEIKIEKNLLKDYVKPEPTLDAVMTKVGKPVVKTGLFLCPTKGDTLLTGLKLEQLLQAQGKLVLSIDCQDYMAQKRSHQAVQLALQKLKFKRQDIDTLKRQEMVILFSNYEQLGAYDNLYVKNELRQWPNVKVLVTCRADFFQHRDYQSCFLSDPANPKMDSLVVHTMPHFAPQEAEAQALSLDSNNPGLDITEQESVLHPKPQAIQAEVRRFLQTLNQILVSEGKLNPLLSENPQAFISYAWEAEKAALARQHRHLSRIARDLSTLGIPTWLDIERMTGDIDEQMAGNIKGSTYALVIGTPRYTQRAALPTNVKKEYLAILEKQAQGDLNVFPLQFADETPFPTELLEHPNGLDFRQIDDETIYLKQLTGLIPQLIEIDPFQYQEQLHALNNVLQLLPAKHLITDKNQDEIQAYDIDNRLKAYVKPHALSKPDDPLDTRYDLPKHFTEYLHKDNTKAYITLGRAGSGKSLFTLSTFKQLLQQWHQWRMAETQTTRPEWLPLYIPLKNYANEKASQAIDLTLKNTYQLDAQDISSLQNGLGINQKILFILDGYDELGKGNRPNYAEQLKDWPHAKLLISGRPEHFDNDAQHRDAFALNQDFNTFKVIYVSPFSPEEIKEYIAAFDANPDTYAKIESIPGLLPLLDNPFLLNLVLQALPRLLETYQNSKQAIKRCDIYRAFIDTLFNKEAYKQQEIHGQTIELANYHQFAEELSFALFTEKTISITPDKASLWQLFTKAEAYIREACPLKRTGDEYSFLHKSVYEYFVATHLWNALNENNEALASRWNTRPLTEERAVIDFIVEFYQTDRPLSSKKPALQFKEQLFALIEGSKTQETLAQAAANAITVLNSANVAFGGKDFRNIRIPGADLSYAICDYTNFSNADLSNVQFQAAFLREANFQNAKMQGIKFGELPSISLEDSPHSLCYSKDGRLLAVAVGDNIQVYNTQTRTRLRTLEGHTSVVASVSFSPNGEQLASGSYDQTIRLWNVARGELLKTLEGHTGPVVSVSFSPNGKQLASGSDDKTIRLWNIVRGELQKTLEGHTNCVKSVSFSPNGEQLASGSGDDWSSSDNTIRIWNVETGELQKTLEGHSRSVNSISFSPNGEQLASGSDDQTIRLWNVARGELQKTLNGHNDNVKSVSFSPNGEQLASGANDIRLWNVARGEVQKTLDGYGGSVSFSPNGEQLASLADKTIRLWDLEGSKLHKTLEEGHTNCVTSVSFSPNGEQLASGSRDKTIRLWNVARGELQKTLQGHTEVVNSISFSSNSELLASVSMDLRDPNIRLWNVETGELQKTFYPPYMGRDCFLSVSFSPNGEQLASTMLSGDIRLWNVETWELLKTLEANIRSYISVSFSPNSELLASASDKTIHLWNVKTGELQKTLEGHTDIVNSVIFSPNGELLASGSRDHTIRLWNVETGELQKTLEGHANGVNCVSFSPNGEQLLVSGGDDQTIRLWNGNSQLTKINTFSNISTLDWKQSLTNGQAYLVTAHEDTSVRYWRVIQIQNTPFLELLWSSKRPTKLLLENANIEGAQWLSLANIELLAQRGAKGKPSMIQPLTIAAEQGDVNAQAEIGKLYLVGKEVPQDVNKAIHFLTQAQLVEPKHPIAAFYLGKCYQKGEGVSPNPHKALELFKLASEGGGFEAQATLGNYYRIGESVPKDLELALKWLNEAATQNNTDAQFGLGECYRLGEGIEQSYKKAFQYYSSAAKQGHLLAINTLEVIPVEIPESRQESYYLALHGDASAQTDTGILYLEGKEVPQNLKVALTWLARAVKQNNPLAQYRLGLAFLKGEGVQPNSEMAIRLFALSAFEGGNISAQATLGNCYRTGEGVKKNLTKALKWIKEAANANNMDAQFWLGECYRLGEGIEQNYKEAFQYYSRAAKQGHLLAKSALSIIPEGFPQSKQELLFFAGLGDTNAQNDIALCFYKGSQGYGSISKDLTKAVEWWTKAAGKGHAEAQNYLGECYKKGEGVSQNLKAAIKWWILAAEQANLSAQIHLGECYENGDGVSQNLETARQWYEKAAEMGDKNAEVKLVRIQLETLNATLQSLIEQPPVAQTAGMSSIEEKTQVVETSRDSPAVSTTASLSAVGFFAQSQNEPVDTGTKTRAEKIESELRLSS